MASCPEGNFSSITNILSQADAGNLNVTLLVQNCSQICTLAWGNGNPDLSGIGANVSYILQFVLIVIFGPLFTLAYSLREDLDLREKTVENIVSLQEGFVDASAQFTIPVAVAAIVRLRQDAPFFEVTFLQSLMTMQFFGLLATIVASGVVDSSRKSARGWLLTLYALSNFGFYMGLVGHLRTSKASFATIRELAQACQGYGAILPGFQDAQTNFPHIDKNAFSRGLFSAHNKGAWIIFGLVLAGIAAVAVLALFVILFAWALEEHNAVFLGMISLGLTAGALYEVVQMELKRNIIKALSGCSFQDNEWGFGQVVSLFLWVPLFIQAVYFITRRGSTESPDCPTCKCAAPSPTEPAPVPAPVAPAPAAAALPSLSTPVSVSINVVPADRPPSPSVDPEKQA